MAVLEFASTATWTRIVSSCFRERFLQLRLFGCQDQHHLCRGTVAAQELGHQPHRPIDMFEEGLVARTQVIQSGLPIGRLDEAVLGTLAVAGETHLALTAVLWQAITLVQAKLPLPVRGHQFDHMLLCNVAEQILRFHKVIA